MALRGKKPETVEKRLKALFYGAAGVGKTTAAIQFPRPYLIDTERGAENEQYTKLLAESGGVIFQTHDFDELLNEIHSLLVEKHDFKTLIIDPLTTLYNDLLDVTAKELKEKSKDPDASGTEFGRHYSEANKRVKRLCNLLLRLDMNVIITSHAKNEYGKDMSVLGQTFDCYKKLDYLFDLVFEIQKRGTQRMGIVKKSRVLSFTDGEQFPFSYESIAEKYGRAILEKDAVPQPVATQEQADKLKRLVDLLKVPQDTVEKWLIKASSEKFEEMPANAIQACIDSLTKKLNEAKGE